MHNWGAQGHLVWYGILELSSTCTEVSGVENIGQCGRLSQLSLLSYLLIYLPLVVGSWLTP